MKAGTATGVAPAKLNLALVVGPTRADGKHEVVTLLQRLELADTLTVALGEQVAVAGFSADTLVHAALEAVREMTGATFVATIEKRVPIAAGLGGGSSDAATALRLANRLLDESIPPSELHAVAAQLGSDVPFFLEDGAQLATADGTMLERQPIPQDFVVLLALPNGAVKSSTADVYAAFDARGGQEGFERRRAALHAALRAVRGATDLAALPRNDLATSSLAARLEQLGAFRADVSGAGPVVYGLFATEPDAAGAAHALASDARTWITAPRW